MIKPVFVCLMLYTASVFAMPIPGEDRFRTSTTTPNAIGGSLGFGAIREDYYLQLKLRTELQLGIVGLGLQLPLNLRVMDEKPYGGSQDILRKEDWDEPAEYLRVIRYVRIGQKQDPFFLRIGELSADLGHGTIMSRYINNVDLNTTRIGAQFDVNTPYAGFESVVGDLGSLYSFTQQSRVMGLRAYVKPIRFVSAQSPLNILSVGFSVVSDLNAPVQLKTNNQGRYQVDSKKHYEVQSERPPAIYGGDLEISLLRSKYLNITPYTDFNTMVDGGFGFHAGVSTLTKLPVPFQLYIPAKFEYRRFQSNYMPAYFSTFYEFERFIYRYQGLESTKRTGITHAGQHWQSGYFGDLALDFLGFLQLGAIYEDTDERGGNFAAYLNVPALKVVQFKAYYARTNVSSIQDVAKIDNRSLAVMQGRYQFMPFAYVVAQVSRRWALNDAGQYQAKDEWNIGVEASYNF